MTIWSTIFISFFVRKSQASYQKAPLSHNSANIVNITKLMCLHTLYPCKSYKPDIVQFLHYVYVCNWIDSVYSSIGARSDNFSALLVKIMLLSLVMKLI